MSILLNWRQQPGQQLDSIEIYRFAPRAVPNPNNGTPYVVLPVRQPATRIRRWITTRRISSHAVSVKGNDKVMGLFHSYSKNFFSNRCKVTLFDAQNQIGGQLNIAKQIPGKPEFAETLRYFDQVLDDVGVVRVLGRKAAAADLQGFDEIVLASGIVPRQTGLPGSERPEVLSYLDVLRDKKPVGRRVAIIGAGGIGFDTAEYLSQHGEDSALSPDLFREEWQIDASMARRGVLLSSEPQLPPPEREICCCSAKKAWWGAIWAKPPGWIHRTVLKYKGVNMLGAVWNTSKSIQIFACISAATVQKKSCLWTMW